MNTINWVPPLPPTPADLLPLPRPNESFFVLAHPKSENKRPQPQSDHAGAVQTMFATFYKNSKYHENTPRRAPQSDVFLHLFQSFSTQVFKGVGSTPQSAEKTQELSPTGAKMASRSGKLEPRSPPKCQKDTNMYSKFPKCQRDCHTRASRSLTMLQKHHQATQSGTYALGKTPWCKNNTHQPPAAGCSPKAT